MRREEIILTRVESPEIKDARWEGWCEGSRVKHSSNQTEKAALWALKYVIKGTGSTSGSLICRHWNGISSGISKSAEQGVLENPGYESDLIPNRIGSQPPRVNMWYYEVFIIANDWCK
jgi:hypothetical protein